MRLPLREEAGMGRARRKKQRGFVGLPSDHLARFSLAELVAGDGGVERSTAAKKKVDEVGG